jgi:hypothetical protein
VRSEKLEVGIEGGEFQQRKLTSNRSHPTSQTGV